MLAASRRAVRRTPTVAVLAALFACFAAVLFVGTALVNSGIVEVATETPAAGVTTSSGAAVSTAALAQLPTFSQNTYGRDAALLDRASNASGFNATQRLVADGILPACWLVCLPSWGETAKVVSFIGLAVGTAALCGAVGAAAPETLGGSLLATGACAAMITTTAAVYSAEFGGGNGGSISVYDGSSSEDMYNLMALILSWYSATQGSLATTIPLIYSLVNTSTPYFGEQAAAAALYQLPNSTFNDALDLVQSGVSDELGSMDFAFPSTESALLSLLAENMSQQELYNNPSDYACNVLFDSQFPTYYPELGGGFDAGDHYCGSSEPSTGNWAGTIYSSIPQTLPVCDDTPTDYADYPALFLNASAGPVWDALYSGTTNITFVSVPDGPTDHTYSVPVTDAEVTEEEQEYPAHLTWPVTKAELPAGNYYACSYPASSVLFPTVGWPIGNDSLTSTHTGSDLDAWENALIHPVGCACGGTNIGWTGAYSPLFLGLNVTSLSGVLPETVQPFTGTDHSGTDEGFNVEYGINDPLETVVAWTIPAWLLGGPWWVANVETAVTTEADAYWAFLRSNGFDSISEVPASCGVPPPSELLPATLTPAVLATLPPTEVEDLYESILNGIGAAYGGTTLDWTNCEDDGLSGLPNLPTSSGGQGPCASGQFVALGAENVAMAGQGCNGGVGAIAVDPLAAYGFGYLTTGCSSCSSHAQCAPDWDNTYEYVDGNTWCRGSDWYEGVIYMAPTLSNASVPLNTTTMLNYGNPTNLWVSPFEDYVAGEGIVYNTTGPYGCAQAAAYGNYGGPDAETLGDKAGLPADGCNTTSPALYLWPVAGNTSIVHSEGPGPKLPTCPIVTSESVTVHDAVEACEPEATSGIADHYFSVYLTACLVSEGISDGVQKWGIVENQGVTTYDCDFDIGSVYAHPWDTTCGDTVSANCAGGGGIGVPPSSCWAPLAGAAAALANALNAIPIIGGTLAGWACFIVEGIAIVAVILTVLLILRET